MLNVCDYFITKQYSQRDGKKLTRIKILCVCTIARNQLCAQEVNETIVPRSKQTNTK